VRSLVALVAVVAVVLLCATACAPDMSIVTQLAKDPATACIHVGAVPPYFSGFDYVRAMPPVNATIVCGSSQIAPLAPK
jgi:hypothetical protein